MKHCSQQSKRKSERRVNKVTLSAESWPALTWQKGGRKNWLFSDTPQGVKTSAAIYSLIETATANGLEPYCCLKYLFENLLEAMTVQCIYSFDVAEY